MKSQWLLFWIFIFSFLSYAYPQTHLDFLKKATELTETKDHKQAIVYFNKVIEIDPKNLSAWQGLGLNYFLIKAYKDSEKALFKALELDDKNATTLMTLGKLFEDQHVFYKASYYYEKVLKLDPYQLEAYWGKGRVFNEDRQYRNAIQVFKKVLELDPYHQGALQGLAFAYRRLGNYDEAITYEKKILELYPEDIGAILRTADHYEARGDIQHAISWYEKAKRVNPKDEKIYVKLAVLYSKTDRIDAAAISLKQAIELQQGNIENYIALGTVYGWLTRLDEGIAVFEKALAIDPRNIKVHSDLASLYLWKGQWDLAEDHFKEVLAAEPKNEIALRGLEGVRAGKKPVVTSRYHYTLDRDRDRATIDRFSVKHELSQEVLYKFSPSFSVEARYQKNERYQNILDGDREYRFEQEIGSFKLKNNFGKNFTFSARGEGNRFVKGSQQLYNFKKSVDRFTCYLYGLWQKDRFFSFASYSRNFVVRRIDPKLLRMDRYDTPQFSMGYYLTPSIQTIVRYSYVDFKELHDRHDVEATTTWRLPFWKSVELGYGFDWLSNPETRVHTLSFELQNEIFNRVLLDFVYKFDIDNNKTDQGITYVNHWILLASLPVYKKLTFNVESTWDEEHGKDHDFTQIYRTYIEIPLGIF